MPFIIFLSGLDKLAAKKREARGIQSLGQDESADSEGFTRVVRFKTYVLLILLMIHFTHNLKL